MLLVVAPAIINPQAHRAEANVWCNPYNGGVIARTGPYAAWVNPGVEFSTGGARAMVYVHCYTAYGDVPCNWELRHLILERYLNARDPIVVRDRYAHQTGVANGYIAAPDSWYPCPVSSYHPACQYLARSPDIYVRFPNGTLVGPRESWEGYQAPPTAALQALHIDQPSVDARPVGVDPDGVAGHSGRPELAARVLFDSYCTVAMPGS